jgi:biotin carboxyl carrier protein
MSEAKRIVFEYKGKQRVGWALKQGSALWVHVDGRSLKIEQSTGSSSRKSKATQADPKKILAPMPGKITSIKIGNGAKITAGQIVVTMEAMKMEYNLKAMIDGTVGEILCKVGQQVKLGDLLVKIEGTTV